MAMQAFFTAMWRTIILRGLASLAFGVLAFTYPNMTLDVVVTLFGIYALADGVLGIWGAYRGTVDKASLPSLLTALASVVAGLICLIFPAFARDFVVLLIGLWNVAAGLFQALGALMLRKEIDNAGAMALSGLLGAALGLLIMFYPAGTAVGIIWIIAGTALIVGLVLVVFGWKLRSVANRLMSARA